MPQYLIERHIPGIECMSPEELKSVARKSNSVLADLGEEIRAPDEELILEHARMTGFPCNRIIEIQKIINPDTGKG